MKKSLDALQAPGEQALVEQVRRLARFRRGRRAMHLRLSRLRESHRQTQHLRIVASILEPLQLRFEGELFRFADDDLMLICKGATPADFEATVDRLCYLFDDDPLIRDQGRVEFCRWFDLEHDYADLRAFAEQALAARTSREAMERTAARQQSQLPAGLPIAVPQLAEVEAAIAQADLSNLMQRQPICAFVRGARPVPLVHEVYFSIEALRHILAPKYDLQANAWLFRNLTRHLDQRMVSLLRRHDDSILRRTLNLSINLNVATLLSPEFLEFDAELNRGSGRTLVIELQLVDVFADMASFLFARDFLRERGYRLCLDGLTHHALPFVDRERLGFDLVKLRWTPELLQDCHGVALRQAVALASPERLILCRCDTPEALEVGRSLGINLYQGYHVDALLTPTWEEETSALAAAMTRHRVLSRG